MGKSMRFRSLYSHGGKLPRLAPVGDENELSPGKKLRQFLGSFWISCPDGQEEPGGLLRRLGVRAKPGKRR